MNLLVVTKAIEDLNSLRTYIAHDNPAAARAMALHITHSIEQLLPDNPQMGRPGRVPGTRELVIPESPFIAPIDCSEMSFKVCASILGCARAREFLSLTRHEGRVSRVLE